VLEAIVEPRFCTIAILILIPVLAQRGAIDLVEVQNAGTAAYAIHAEQHRGVSSFCALSRKRHPKLQPSPIFMHESQRALSCQPAFAFLLTKRERLTPVLRPAFHIGAGLCRRKTRRALIQSWDHSADAARLPSLLFWRANQFLRPQRACRLRHSSAVARYSSRVCVTTLPEPRSGLSSHPSQSVQMGLKSINLHNFAVRPFGFHEPLPAVT